MRRADGAQQLHDGIDLVLEELGPAVFMDLQQRAPDGVFELCCGRV